MNSTVRITMIRPSSSNELANPLLQKFPSLTEFSKHLGRSGICRVEDTEKGLYISWIDNSPEALRRQDTIRKKERQDKGDEEREQRMIAEQIERAELDVFEKGAEGNDQTKELKRQEGEKITLNFGAKPRISKPSSPPETKETEAAPSTEERTVETSPATSPSPPPTITTPAPTPQKISLSMNPASSKPKNVFAAKKSPLSGSKPAARETPKKMSEAERIMKEEIERKRAREANGFRGLDAKRQKIA